MHRLISLLLALFALICIATYAADSNAKRAVAGIWVLTKSVDGKVINNRPGDLTRTPEGVGYVYLDDGHFLVPGENAGSNRHTIPRGFHFDIRPHVIDDDGVVADLLVSYTDIRDESETGFAAEKHQIDGRYGITFGDPISITLTLPDGKTKYDLSITLRPAK